MGHHHHHSAEVRSKEARRITLIGALLDTVLGIAKLIVGVIFNSAALIADGIHSLSDLVTDFLVVGVMHFSHQGPDKEHPWGHARFETVGTVFLGTLLIAVAGAMAYDSSIRLFHQEEMLIPGWPTLVIAALSILSKEWIFRWTKAVGERLKSDLLIANAWHSRTDAFSSIVVFVGILGAMWGFTWLDTVAAILVAIMVGHVGWELSWNSIKELVDTSLPEEQVKELTAVAESVEGIISVHDFKTRSMGQESLLEMHIQVAPFLSASEGHYLGDQVVRAIKRDFEDIGHIIFHIDTYNDEDEKVCRTLPTRAEIEHAVRQALADQHQNTDWHQLTIHYTRMNVVLELKLIRQGDDTHVTKPAALEAQLNQQLQQHAWFANLTLWQQDKSAL